VFRFVATSQQSDQARPNKRVWDLPVRLFHWGIAVCFGVAWFTIGDRWLDFHVFSGYLLGGLLLFRLYWGLYGEPNARFRDFAFGLRAAYGYVVTILRGRPARYLGHNPAGSWAIWLMLVLLLSLVVTGVLTLGGEERHGPFAGWLGFSAGAVLHRVHEILAWVMVGVVAVHLLGVLVESLLHRENLVAAMVTGNKREQGSTPPVHTRSGVAMLLLVFPLLFAAGWFKGYLLQDEKRPYLPFVGPDLADNPLWREECGGCHLAYHPSLLPARSWVRMMEQQVDHFGEDLALEPVDAETILEFQTANSAERAATEAAWKINNGISREQTPLRITETGYWKRKHREIGPVVWDGPAVNGRWNCDACHLDAARGTFEDGAMIIPD
jgi:cytochrome b